MMTRSEAVEAFIAIETAEMFRDIMRIALKAHEEEGRPMPVHSRSWAIVPQDVQDALIFYSLAIEDPGEDVPR